jgi:hypothetical protein
MTCVRTAGLLPDHHPNIDQLLRNGTRAVLPSDHPPINPWVGAEPAPPVRTLCVAHSALWTPPPLG